MIEEGEDGDRPILSREDSIKDEIADVQKTAEIIRGTIRVEGEKSENYFVKEINNIISQQYLMVRLGNV